MGELRPCPFCGGEAQYSVLGPIGDSVLCSHCLMAPRILHREHEATTAWNTRPTEDALIAALEALYELHASGAMGNIPDEKYAVITNAAAALAKARGES